MINVRDISQNSVLLRIGIEADCTLEADVVWLEVLTFFALPERVCDTSGTAFSILSKLLLKLISITE